MQLRKPIERNSKFYVYIIQCKDGTFYTGYTNNLERRLAQHNSGKGGAKYTSWKGFEKLVYCKEYKYYKSALNAEREIKTYTRKEKEELIRKFIPPVLSTTKLPGGPSGIKKMRREQKQELIVKYENKKG